MPSMHISLKRVYEPASADDGVRILVERLWPRGLTKADAAIDHWVKDVRVRRCRVLTDGVMPPIFAKNAAASRAVQ